jgi:hypothetical protein
MPMISRSDGKLFHLLLADRPLPYPAEKQANPSVKLSVCFWYSHVNEEQTTFSTVVILPDSRVSKVTLYRQIDHVADVLAEKLVLSPQIAGMYEFERGALVEVPIDGRDLGIEMGC